MCDKCDFRAIIAAEIDRHVRQVITNYFGFHQKTIIDKTADYGDPMRA